MCPLGVLNCLDNMWYDVAWWWYYLRSLIPLFLLLYVLPIALLLRGARRWLRRRQYLRM